MRRRGRARTVSYALSLILPLMLMALPIIDQQASAANGILPVTECELSGELGNNGWHISDVTVYLNATVDGGSVKSTQYRIDSGGWEDYSAPLNISTSGVYLFEFFSISEDDCQENIKNATIKVDKQLPSGAITPSGTTGLNDWYVSEVTIEIATIDNTSGIAEIKYRIGDRKWNVYIDPFSIRWGGVHLIEAEITDLAGNMRMISYDNLSIDTNLPTVEIEIQNGTLFESDIAIVPCHVSDSISGVGDFEYSLDDSEYVLYDNHTAIVLHGLSDGMHVLRVRVTDMAGNSVETAVEFMVNTWEQDSTAIGLAVSIGTILAILIYIFAGRVIRES